MLKLCGETQDRLAQELILFEFTIERDVIEPLYDLAEVKAQGCDCSSIHSMPKSLWLIVGLHRAPLLFSSYRWIVISVGQVLFVWVSDWYGPGCLLKKGEAVGEEVTQSSCVFTPNWCDERSMEQKHRNLSFMKGSLCLSPENQGQIEDVVNKFRCLAKQFFSESWLYLNQPLDLLLYSRQA